MIKDRPCNGQCPVSTVALCTEAVEDCFLAFGSELEYDSTLVGPTPGGRPVQISFPVGDQPCGGLCPIGAVGLCTEAVEDRLLAFRRELEYYATPVATAAGLIPAPIGRPIQASLLIDDQPRKRICPIRAGRALRTETVEDCFLAFWRDLEYDSSSVGPAVLGRAIQVFLLVQDQPYLRTHPILAVIPRTEAMEDRLLTFRRELEHDACTAVTAAVKDSSVRGRPIQVSLLVENQPCYGILPMDLVTIRKQKGEKKRLPMKDLTGEQFQALLKALESNPELRTMVIVTLNSGLRISETRGLQWKDVDWLAKTVTLIRGVVKQDVDDVKTEDSARTMPLADGVIAVLTVWKQVSEFYPAR